MRALCALGMEDHSLPLGFLASISILDRMVHLQMFDTIPWPAVGPQWYIKSMAKTKKNKSKSAFQMSCEDLAKIDQETLAGMC